MNNDNEKDLSVTDCFDEDSASVETEVASAEEVNEEIGEVLNADATQEPVEATAENDCDCCNCGCAECEGVTCEDCTAAPVKKAKTKVVLPIIIAAAAFVAVAVLVFGGVFVYNAFFGTSLKGVWVEEGYENSGIYFDFDGNGNVYLRGGGITYFGTYETAGYDVDKDSELPEIITKISEKETLSGKVNVLKTDFYMFGVYGGEYVYSTGNEDGKNTVTMKFLDTSGAVSQWKFSEARLPDFSMDPEKITNASADEAGVTSLKTDKNIIGTWSEADYGTYTFYEDGTGSYKTDYQIDQSYQLFYGVTMGYGVDLSFKYTVNDGKIYMTVDYYTGDANDGVMTYYLDGKNLVIDGVGYAKVESTK